LVGSVGGLKLFATAVMENNLSTSWGSEGYGKPVHFQPELDQYSLDNRS
jgi:hypothetical protein